MDTKGVEDVTVVPNAPDADDDTEYDDTDSDTQSIGSLKEKYLEKVLSTGGVGADNEGV